MKHIQYKIIKYNIGYKASIALYTDLYTVEIFFANPIKTLCT